MIELNAQGYWEYRHDLTGIIFVRLPGGKFDMGGPNTEGGSDHERPVHEVTLSPFLIAKYEVTQGQWMAVMRTNPSLFSGDDNLPVELVSWDAIQGFEMATGLTLPTEAQWEYACRGGTTTPWAGRLNDMGWYVENSGGTTHSVGGKAPNGFGLYDMHGNVSEWCEDSQKIDFYSLPAASGPDPVFTQSFGSRIIRGGGWRYSATFCRSAYRDSDSPSSQSDSLGFRPSRQLP